MDGDEMEVKTPPSSVTARASAGEKIRSAKRSDRRREPLPDGRPLGIRVTHRSTSQPTDRLHALGAGGAMQTVRVSLARTSNLVCTLAYRRENSTASHRSGAATGDRGVHGLEGGGGCTRVGGPVVDGSPR